MFRLLRRRLSYRRVSLLAAVVLALGLTACELDNPFSRESPTAPQVDVVQIAGSCRATSTQAFTVACECRSTWSPLEAVRSIAMSLQDADGLLVEARPIDPTQIAPRQVLFTGLRPGTYQVEHTLQARGGQTYRALYRPLVVPENGLGDDREVLPSWPLVASH